jgi:hypothetical protein
MMTKFKRSEIRTSISMSALMVCQEMQSIVSFSIMSMTTLLMNDNDAIVMGVVLQYRC